MQPSAVVMNMFYTGLGIARSLGRHNVPVVGLTAQRGVYGNFTRFAKTVYCPDSRREPEALLAFLQNLARDLGHRAVIFPTRDDDVVFLDRFREELEPHFILTVPRHSAVSACLNKWETYQWAERAGVATPKCWLIEKEQDLQRVLPEVTYPCVLKPLAAHHWRQGTNWKIVGGRKAVRVSSPQELIAEYGTIARADERALLQQMVPGGDDCLTIAACYLDRRSDFVAGFNAQKLLQVPEEFGTGCIVQSTHRPEIFEPAVRLLKAMSFNGIAEVEFKWDATKQDYQLIEVNPRPWDQHRLGPACGIDLVYLAYCEHAGLRMPAVARPVPVHKWIAEDAFLAAALHLLRRRDPRLRSLFHLARGKRVYAMWSAADPLPFLAYLTMHFIPGLLASGVRVLGSALRKTAPGEAAPARGDEIYERHLEKGKSHT